MCARLLYNQTAEFAGVMELVDVLDSKSSAARRAGSSPATGTIFMQLLLFEKQKLFLLLYAAKTVYIE